jgi:hypothetical protein
MPPPAGAEGPATSSPFSSSTLSFATSVAVAGPPSAARSITLPATGKAPSGLAKPDDSCSQLLFASGARPRGLPVPESDASASTCRLPSMSSAPGPAWNSYGTTPWNRLAPPWSTATISACVSFGACSSSSATAPVTCGADMLVPEATACVASTT